MNQSRQESPELVLVAPPELRADALAALAPSIAALAVAQEPEPDEPGLPQELEPAKAMPPSSRHPDLDRFGFLAQVPERETDRSWHRVAWLAAVSAAVVLGAMAPVMVALLLR